MSIILVRHGETAGNFERVLQKPETPLNDVGLRQAELLAARVRELGAVQLLASDYARAHVTAEAISRQTGLSVERIPLLRERNMGDWRGRAYASFDFHPLAPDKNPPNGESWSEFHARVRDAFAFLVERRSALAGPLLVVTHGQWLMSLFTRLLPSERVPQAFANTSISILDPTPPHAATLVNCARHLEATSASGEI